MKHEIKWQDETTKGKAYIGEVDTPLAAISFTRVGPSIMIINHTEVDDSLRGQGVGQQLLAQVVNYAREKNIRIIPLCPFAKSVFDKDESIGDVLYDRFG
jgi:predicted GNAT family acetyltransferase